MRYRVLFVVLLLPFAGCRTASAPVSVPLPVPDKPPLDVVLSSNLDGEPAIFLKRAGAPDWVKLTATAPATTGRYGRQTARASPSRAAATAISMGS